MRTLIYVIGDVKTTSYEIAKDYAAQAGEPIKAQLKPMAEEKPRNPARLEKVRKFFAKKRLERA